MLNNPQVSGWRIGTIELIAIGAAGLCGLFVVAGLLAVLVVRRRRRG